MNKYYRFPLLFEELIQKKELKQTDLNASIAQNVYLILTSEFGEYRYDETYGCALWDYDFENISSVHNWKEQIAQSVRQSIMRHEHRLDQVKVKVDIGQEEKPLLMVNRSVSRLKKCVDVTVSGNIVETNQPFPPYVQRLYISPFSFD